MASTQRGQADSRAGRVLIVEDEEIVREVFEQALVGRHDVATAKNGTEALALANGDAFDVVLADLGLPDLPGNEVVAEIKRGFPGVVAILATGWVLQEDDPRLDPFDLRLEKPVVSLDDLRGVVADAIRLRDGRGV